MLLLLLAIRSQLWSKLHSKLHGLLPSQLRSQPHFQLLGEPHSER
jgi:hypothetical protein